MRYSICFAIIVSLSAVHNLSYGAAVVDCKDDTQVCTGLYDGSHSSIQRQKRQLGGQQPPVFEATLPGGGMDVELCEAFSSAVTADPPSSGNRGSEPFAGLGCGAKWLVPVREYLREGSPTPAIADTSTTSTTTMAQLTVGQSVGVTVNGGAVSGTVTASIQNTTGTSWTNTISYNNFIWTANYIPQPDPSARQWAGRCGTRDSILVKCMEH